MPTTKTPRNWTYGIVCTIVRAYMLGALAISFNHIITAAHLLDLTGWQAYTVPFAIDGFAVLGMIGRSRRFSTATQRTGLKLQCAAGALSLTCNIYAGHSIGQRIYGALIVTAFIVAETYGAKLAPAPAPAPEVDEQATKRSAAAKQAAATRAANKATAAEQAQAQAAADRRERRRIAAAAKRAENDADKALQDLAAGKTPGNAPTSPAPVHGYL